MLIDIMTDRVITRVPHEDRYRVCSSRLTAAEMAAAMSAIDERIDSDTIHTAAWMPGKNWDGTPYEALFTKAARQDHTLSAMFFGLLVWTVFAGREDEWASDHYEFPGQPLGTRVYFRIYRRRNG
jgi:hypothetical protein